MRSWFSAHNLVLLIGFFQGLFLADVWEPLDTASTVGILLVHFGIAFVSVPIAAGFFVVVRGEDPSREYSERMPKWARVDVIQYCHTGGYWCNAIAAGVICRDFFIAHHVWLGSFSYLMLGCGLHAGARLSTVMYNFKKDDEQ